MNATILTLLLTAAPPASLGRPAAAPAARPQAAAAVSWDMTLASTATARPAATSWDMTLSKPAAAVVITGPALYDAPGRYPLRGNLWTGLGGSREAAIRHLMQGAHAGVFSRDYLEGLSYGELSALHSDHHEGRVQWAYAHRSAPRQPIARAPAYFSVPCPNGRCPR